VTVWDLSTGEEYREFFSTVMGRRGGLAWAGEFLLVGNQFLFDVERRILLWEYQDAPGMGMTAKQSGGRLFFIPKSQEENESVLVSTAVPHASALNEASSLPSAEELLVVRPGDEVAIETDIDPSVSMGDEIRESLNGVLQTAGAQEAENPKVVVINPRGAQNDVIRKALAARLEAAGLRVVESAHLVVKAVCKPQPQQTIRVNMDGRWPVRGSDIAERTITPHASYLEMTLGGDVLWKRGFVARPGMVILLQRGETLDLALERLTKPNVKVFTEAKFSAYVARPGTATDNGAYGVSQFTTQGVVDGSSRGGRGGIAFE
jgi:citrate lyase gamma subunit